MDKLRKSFLTLISLLAVFFFLILMLTLSFIFVAHSQSASGLIFIFIKYHIHFMVFLGLLGMGVGFVSYYSFNEQKKDVIKSQKFSEDILFKFLDLSERKIVELLLNSEKFTTTQAAVSRLPEMGKVKAYRTIQRLEQKNIISLESFGKTNNVILAKDIVSALRNK